MARPGGQSLVWLCIVLISLSLFNPRLAAADTPPSSAEAAKPAPETAAALSEYERSPQYRKEREPAVADYRQVVDRPGYAGRDQRDDTPAGRDAPAEGEYHSGYTHTFDSEKMKLTININVAGKDTYATIDYPPPGYDTRYLTGGGPENGSPPYDMDDTPKEPYAYRGSQQKPYNAKRRGPEPTHHSYYGYKQETRNSYNFRALPGSEVTTVGVTSVPGPQRASPPTNGNLPVIIAYKAKLTCGTDPGSAGGVGTCMATGVGPNQENGPVLMTFTCSIDADASSLCGEQYPQGLVISAQGMVFVTYARDANTVLTVTKLQADVIPITAIYVAPQPAANAAKQTVQYTGGSLQFRSNGDSDGKFSITLVH